MKFTPYVEECWQSIGEIGEVQSDKLAAALVRLQMIIEKIHQSLWHDKYESFGISPDTIFIVNSIQEQLKRFRKDLPADLEHNGNYL